MALSGTIIGSKTGQFGVEIDWTGSQSIANNSTTVTARVYITYYTINISSRTVACAINGIKQTASVAAIEKQSGSSVTRKLVGTFTQVINHNSTGEASSFTIAASFPFKLTQTSTGNYIGTLSASGTVSLDTIPRASSISSAGDVTLGNKCSIKWTPLASSFAYKVKLACGGITHTSDYITPGSTSAYTYAATMSVSYWAGAMSNSYSGTCTATLYTYTSSSSSTAIGSDSITFKITLSNSTSPSVNFATPTLVNGWNGYYIQGKSQCTLSATFKAGAGSSIKSCSISGTGISLAGASTSLSGTTSVLTKSGTITYTAKVTDGRETVSTTQTITVYPYAAPTLSLTAVRVTNSTSIKVTYKAACSSVNSKNSLQTLVIYKKLATASTWTTAQTISLNSISASDSVTLTGFELTSSYDFKATVTDAVGRTTEKMAGASTDFRLFNMRKSEDGTQGGIALGKLSEDYTFDCDLEAQFGKTLHAKDKITTESIFGSAAVYSANNFAIACQWADGSNHDLLVRNSDGKTIGLGWVGSASYPTTLDIRPSTVNCRGTFSAPYGRFTSTGDAAVDSQNDVALRIGNPSGEHIDFDANEMQAKANETTASQFTINYGGGDVYIGSTTYGGNLIVRNTLQATQGRFISTADASAASQNDVALRVGNPNGEHIDFDGNEIQAKDAADAPGALVLNHEGGQVKCGKFVVPEIQRGSITIVPSANNTPTAKIVTFSKSFSGAPTVVAAPQTSVPGTYVTGVGAMTPSKDEVTIYCTRTNTTATMINWIAVYY